MEVMQDFGSDFFINNRKRLRELFGGTAPIVVAAHGLLQKSADSTYDFVQDSNFWYLTGINEPGLILVMETDHEYLILPERDPIHEIFEGKVDSDHLKKVSGVEEILSEELGWKQLSKRLKKVKHLATIQPPKSYISQMEMYTNPSKARLLRRAKEANQSLSLIDIRSFMTAMRSVKQPIELENMNYAIHATIDFYKTLHKAWPMAESEKELDIALRVLVAKKGVGFAYDSIIASGKNAITLHYCKNNDLLDADNFLLVDAAARVGMYNSDVTRSVVKKPSKRQTQLYAGVLGIQEFAISLLKPGISLKDYEQQVFQFVGEKLRELGLVKTIDKESVRTFYPHSTSHFIGIDVHDVGDYEAPLKPGMVVTVEPGIYIAQENTGIRLEDMILITEEGNSNLTDKIPKIIDDF